MTTLTNVTEIHPGDSVFYMGETMKVDQVELCVEDGEPLATLTLSEWGTTSFHASQDLPVL